MLIIKQLEPFKHGLAMSLKFELKLMTELVNLSNSKKRTKYSNSESCLGVIISQTSSGGIGGLGEDGMVTISTGESLVFLFARNARAVALRVDLEDFDASTESVEMYYDNEESSDDTRRRQIAPDAGGVVLLTQDEQVTEDETKLGYTRYRLVPSEGTTFSVSQFVVRLMKDAPVNTLTPPSSIEDDESTFMFGLPLLYLLLIAGGILLCLILLIVMVVCVIKRQRREQDERDTLSPDYSFTEHQMDDDYFGTQEDDDDGANGEYGIVFICLFGI